MESEVLLDESLCVPVAAKLSDDDFSKSSPIGMYLELFSSNFLC